MPLANGFASRPNDIHHRWMECPHLEVSESALRRFLSCVDQIPRRNFVFHARVFFERRIRSG
jgi:hypothetical protein